MTKRRPPGDYPVGYGKPPEHGKIKPGERRNPSGRPRRPRAPDDIARRFLSEKVPILVRGKPLRITRYEANLRNLYQMAMKGDVRASQMIHHLGSELGLTIAPSHDMRIIVSFVEPDGKGGMKTVGYLGDDMPDKDKGKK